MSMDKRDDSEEANDSSDPEENADVASESVDESEVSSTDKDSDDLEQEKTEQKDNMLELGEQFYQINDLVVDPGSMERNSVEEDPVNKMNHSPSAVSWKRSRSAMEEDEEEVLEILADMTRHDRIMRLNHAAFVEKQKALQNETDPDYLAQVTALERERDLRHKTADIDLQRRKEMLMRRYHSERQSNMRTKEDDLKNLYSQMREEITTKMEKLTKERHRLDYDPELSNMLTKGPKQKKRAVEVTGPTIVLELRMEEIMSDLACIAWEDKQKDLEKECEF